MTNKRWEKVVFVFSIILLLFSLAFFLYTKFNLKYSNKLNKENDIIKSQILKINQNINNLEAELSNVEIELNQKSLDFYENYGYQFDGNREDEIKNIISNLNTENDKILMEMTQLIKDNSNYFTSNIYSDERYDQSVDLFFNLSNDNNLERYQNLYEELSISQLTSNADGFIGYLRNRNSESKELNVLLYYLSVYGFKLNNFSNNSYKSLGDVYSDLNSYYEIISEIEKLGYSTGDLNSTHLLKVKDSFNELLIPFYKNRGLIKSLEKGGKIEVQK
ncbi:putative PurR-regulated permease PerM [Peptoniphilus olsenii]|uniref:PurR-regulated permease PerM n=1 Tax=Peptoniphilus olsenii TaxID=411570 RepID=A0ABV2J6S0_9FIRM